jgi:2-desacetyl-2-hydroxyethyl bacteriochlorophyllide A dehydrogenase
MDGGLKSFLNTQANRRLAQLGYSDGEIQEAKRNAWWWLQARARMAARRRALVSGHAVLWTGPGRAQLVSIEVPLAGPGEVTIDVLASAISPGTERAQYLRLPNTGIEYPHMPGYSASGIVRAAGRGVTHVSEGDLVAGRGLPHASVATVAAELVYRVPDGVTVEAASTVQIGTICSLGVRRADLRPGDSVCVLGTGLIGALAQRLTSRAGAGQVAVIATSRSKERVVRSGGATLLVAGEDDERIRALRAPAVIEATGDPAALGTAVAAAGEAGRIVLLGSSRGTTREVPVLEIREKGLSLVGAHVETLAAESRLVGDDLYRREAETYLRALAGGLQVDDLVDWALDPREADRAYRELARRSDITGGRFDWALLPSEQRPRRASVFRKPDVTPRGVDFARKPVAADRHVRPSSDPFGDAVGDLRIGLLGCGEIGLKNAEAIAAAPNARLVGCFDPTSALAEELGRLHDTTVHSSTESLVTARDVDAVMIAVPHHLHAPLATTAVRSGKHLIVEKPPANNLEAALELVATAQDAGVVLSFCFPHRYQPGVERAKALIDGGALGDFAGMSINVLSKKPETYWYGGFSGRSASDWRTSKEKAGGGFLIMNLCHYLDVIRHLVGVEVDVVSAFTQPPEPGREVEDAVTLAIRYENAAIGSAVGSAALAGFESGRTEINLWGRDGHIALEPALRAYTQRALGAMPTGRWLSFEVGRRSEIEIRAIYVSRLASAIARSVPPDVTAADGLAIQALMEAAYRSSDSAETVRPRELLAAVEPVA